MAQLAIDMDARINLISSLYKVNDDEIFRKGTQSTGLSPGQRLCTTDHTTKQPKSLDLPRPGEVTEVDNDGFGQSNLRLGVVTGEVVEAIHQGRSENIGQFLPMHCAHSLQQTAAHIRLNLGSHYCLHLKVFTA